MCRTLRSEWRLVRDAIMLSWQPKRKKRDRDRRIFEERLQQKDDVIKKKTHEGRQLVENEPQQSHALRTSLIQVSRPTQDNTLDYLKAVSIACRAHGGTRLTSFGCYFSV